MIYIERFDESQAFFLYLKYEDRIANRKSFQFSAS
jgi:hypothetical protein